MGSDGHHPEVRFRLLGPLEVTVDGRTVELGGTRSRGVLAMLLLARGRSVSEHALLDALWGDDPPRTARNSLQSHISRLRQRLVEVGGRDLGHRLRRDPGGYRLSVEPGEVDAAHVDDLLARVGGASGTAGPAAALLEEALSCWRGPPLADLVDLPGWHTCGLAAARVRFDELESAVREELLAARLAAGAHDAALPELEQAAVAQPLRERVHRMLALALYRSGRVTDALAALRRYRDRLVDEAGLDPSAELAELEQAILSADPALSAPVQVAAPGRHDVAARAHRPGGELVGRRGELGQLLDRVGDADAGQGGVVLVTGDPGIGKTTLLTALADAAAERGAVVLSGRCLDGTGTVAYHPFAEAVTRFLAAGPRPPDADLAAITPLLPNRAAAHADEQPGPALAPDEQRLRLLDGMAGFLLALTRTATVVVAIDDLHWADASTVAMLRHLARATPGHRLVLVGTYRSGELPGEHPLSNALAELRSETDCTAVHLGGLEPSAIEQLLTRTAGAPLAAELATAIAQQTGGNPLFAREMVRHLLDEDVLHANTDGLLHTRLPLRSVPEGVRQVIARRRRRLSTAANHLLDTAATTDGPFPFEPVADVAELDPAAALSALDEALDAGLVAAEPAPDRYDFAHALIRQTIYTTLNPSRRLRLHRRLAEALTQARATGLSIGPAEIAVQYLGSVALPGAEAGVEPAVEAAALARAAGAHDEDAAFLALARELAPPDDPRQHELLARSAVALAWSQRFDEALEAARAALDTTAREAGPATAVALAADVAMTFVTAGGNVHAWELARQGLELAGQATAGVDPVSRAELTLLDLERRESVDPANPGVPMDVPERRDALRVLTGSGRLAGRADLGQYAVAAIYGSRDRVPDSAAGDPIVAMLLMGDFRAALSHFDAEAVAARSRGQLAWELYCRSGIAHCHAALGDLAAAARTIDEGDALAARMAGDRTSWPLATYLGARDALTMARDTGWEQMLTAWADLLGPGPPEHQWAMAALAAAAARGHARLGEAPQALRLLARPVRDLRRAPAWAPNYLRTACDVAETLWLLDTHRHLAAVETVLRRLVRADFRAPMMDVRLALARVCALDGRDDEARGWFDASRTVLDAQSARSLRAVVDYDEALMHTRRGDDAAATPLAAAAADRFGTLRMTGWQQRLSNLPGAGAGAVVRPGPQVVGLAWEVSRGDGGCGSARGG